MGNSWALPGLGLRGRCVQQRGREAGETETEPRTQTLPLQIPTDRNAEDAGAPWRHQGMERETFSWGSSDHEWAIGILHFSPCVFCLACGLCPICPSLLSVRSKELYAVLTEQRREYGVGWGTVFYRNLWVLQRKKLRYWTQNSTQNPHTVVINPYPHVASNITGYLFFKVVFSLLATFSKWLSQHIHIHSPGSGAWKNS